MNAREQWLADRRKGIGGSDIGAILGLSPYRTLMDVFLDKRGETQPKGNEQAMYWAPSSKMSSPMSTRSAPTARSSASIRCWPTRARLHARQHRPRHHRARDRR